MNEQLASYIKRNIMMVVTISVLGFLLLAAGEYMLYRQQIHLNKMVSEGFMQLKEDQDKQSTDSSTMMEEGTTESDSMMLEE